MAFAVYGNTCETKPLTTHAHHPHHPGASVPKCSSLYIAQHLAQHRQVRLGRYVACVRVCACRCERPKFASIFYTHAAEKLSHRFGLLWQTHREVETERCRDGDYARQMCALALDNCILSFAGVAPDERRMVKIRTAQRYTRRQMFAVPDIECLVNACKCSESF